MPGRISHSAPARTWVPRVRVFGPGKARSSTVPLIAQRLRQLIPAAACALQRVLQDVPRGGGTEICLAVKTTEGDEVKVSGLVIANESTRHRRRKYIGSMSGERSFQWPGKGRAIPGANRRTRGTHFRAVTECLPLGTRATRRGTGGTRLKQVKSRMLLGGARAMQELTLVLFFAAVMLAGFASNDAIAQKVSVTQLEQVLAATNGKPDAEVAQRLAEFELTERLNALTLAKLKGQLPGEKARQALMILADESAFFAPPATDLPVKPAPDATAQRQMMASVVSYVTKTVHQLPNFSATRDTAQFEDRPQSSWDNAQPMHFVSQSGAPVFYRDGQELVDTSAEKRKKRTPEMQGLASWGEFGPILSTVLQDAAQSALTWSHWEQSASGLEAVFSYEVPAKKSHYRVQFCCVTEDTIVAAGVQPMHFRVFHELAAYHGEISVDPATGAILRVTVEAVLAPGAPLTKASIMVEYDAVEIGGKSFICPLRSVALAQKHVFQETLGARPAAAFDRGPLKTFLNDVAFGHYHRLGSEMHILNADIGEPSGNLAASEPVGEATPRLQPLSTMTTESPKTTEGVASPGAPADGTAGTSSPALEVALPAPPVPEITVSASNGIPDGPTNPDSNRNGQSLSGTSRRVVVGVVVYDHMGYPVKNLKQADFEIYDNGSRQATGEATLASEHGATILLVDESHIPSGDLKKLREQILKFLAVASPGERVGLYAIGGDSFQVLAEVSTDHAALIERLRNWTPSIASSSQSSASPVDSAHASMKFLDDVAQHLAALPGHKSLVWVSTDSLFVDVHDKQAASESGVGYKQLDETATRVVEAMNDANVAVIPFDVSQSGGTQLAGGAISADAYSRSTDTFAQIQTSQAIELPIQWPIREVAKATGGLTIQHSSGLARALSQIVEDSDATYLINFSPQGPGDGKYHTINIKVAGKSGFTLRYRTGYMSAKEPVTLKERFQQAIWQPADASEIKVTAVVAETQSGGGLKINITASNLGLLQQDGHWMDKLYVFFVQREDAGLHAEVEGQTLSLRLTLATYNSMMAAGVPFESVVKLKHGTTSLRVLVVDENSGRIGSFTIPAQALGGAS